MEFPIFCLSAASVLIVRGDRVVTASQAKSFFIGNQGGCNLFFDLFRGENGGSTAMSSDLKRAIVM